MDTTRAIAGWLWIKEGFALFRKQPGQLTTLILFYIFTILAFNLVPLVGGIIATLLTPVFSVGLLQACADVDQEKPVHPRVLLTGFRSAAFSSLVKLGSLYLLTAILALMTFLAVDDGLFMQMMNGQTQPDPKVIENSNMGMAMLSGVAVYLPLTMAFWFIAPLMAWQNIGLGKALFYNVFTVWHRAKCFLLYLLCWSLIMAAGLIVAGIVSLPVSILLGKDLAVGIVTLSMMIVLYAVFYCSFYRSYMQLFTPAGMPENAEDSPVQS